MGKGLTKLIIVLVLIAVAAWALLGRGNHKPNVIVILVDTLRADHMSFNGYERQTSPVLDAFAAESLNFTSAFVGATWTAPSVASIFTGLYPSAHGMMPPNSRVKAAEKFSFKLSQDLKLFAEVFKEQGYQTAGVSANPWIGQGFGYTQGFDYFYSPGHITGAQVNEKAFGLIDKWRSPDKPLLLYLHYIDPHDPYSAPKPFKNFFKGKIADDRYNDEAQDLIARYDSEIRYVDNQIGELFNKLKASGLYDDSVIVLISDHGEQFWERGNHGHGLALFNEELRVPFVLRMPGGKSAETIEEPVSSVDLYPTLLDLIGAKPAAGLHGVSLLSDRKSWKDRAILMEISRRYNYKGYISPEGQKFIASYDLEKGLYVDPKQAKEYELYDFKNDPLEQTKITNPSNLELFKSVFERAFGRIGKDAGKYKVDSMEMNDKTLKELETLGYF